MSTVRGYADIDSKNVRGRAILEFTDRTACEAGLKFGPAANIWSIGKVMWDLMTLAHRSNFDQMLDEIELAEDDNGGGGNDGADPEDYITIAENAITNDRCGSY